MTLADELALHPAPADDGTDQAAADPQQLLARFDDVRGHTETLAAPLSPEDQTVQSMPDVSPTKWHRAHVTWFFETFLLSEHEDRFSPFEERYWFLFNSYYETLGPRYARPDRGLVTRPGAHEVGRYRENVDDRVRDLVDRLGRTDTGLLDALRPTIELGFHHEQQHQELLLMDIKHVLSRNPMEPAYVDHRGFHPAADQPAADQPAGSGTPGWVDVEGGLVEVGHRGSGFSFDNELPRHRQWLEPYRLADRLVTNGEWLHFVLDGGYDRHALWLSDGWGTVQREGWRAPLYWVERDGTWWEHTLHGTHPLDLAAPVCHVSFYEADAYATWAGARLPTEGEWEHAVTTVPGVRQVDREVWQWTQSAYHPYPGFAAPEGAIGEYNGKFMSGQMVLRGGCALTSPGHARATYRNFFPHAARWAMSGVRLADGGAPQGLA